MFEINLLGLPEKNETDLGSVFGAAECSPSLLTLWNRNVEDEA